MYVVHLPTLTANTISLGDLDMKSLDVGQDWVLMADLLVSIAYHTSIPRSA